MDVVRTFVECRRLLSEQRYFGAGGRLHKTIVHNANERAKGKPTERYSWYDFHATT